MGDWRFAHVQGNCPKPHVHAFLKATSRATANVASELEQDENERRRICQEVPLYLTMLASDAPFGLGGDLCLAENCTTDGRILDAGLLNEKSPCKEDLAQELLLLGQRCPGLHLVVHVGHVSYDHMEPSTVEYCLELLPTGLVHDVRASLAVIDGRRLPEQARYQYMLMAQLHGMERTMRPVLVPSVGYAAWYVEQHAEVYTWWLVDMATGQLFDAHGTEIKAE